MPKKIFFVPIVAASEYPRALRGSSVDAVDGQS